MTKCNGDCNQGRECDCATVCKKCGGINYCFCDHVAASDELESLRHQLKEAQEQLAAERGRHESGEREDEG